MKELRESILCLEKDIENFNMTITNIKEKIKGFQKLLEEVENIKNITIDVVINSRCIASQRDLEYRR